MTYLCESRLSAQLPSVPVKHPHSPGPDKRAGRSQQGGTVLPPVPRHLTGPSSLAGVRPQSPVPPNKGRVFSSPRNRRKGAPLGFRGRTACPTRGAPARPPTRPILSFSALIPGLGRAPGHRP